MSLRWDKYIWAVRLAKTRSQASEELSKGRIKVNGQTIKPAKELKTYRLAQREYRQIGSGTRSQKDRREIDDFLVDWE